jgi:hypothetical protein
MTDNKPERARVLTLELQADTDAELADALRNVASLIDRGRLTNGVSGGYSSGYIYDLRDGNCPDHDAFAQRLRRYLDRMALIEANPPGIRMESKAQIEDGHLLIRLSIPTLAHAARHSDYFFQSRESGTPLVITNEAVFAESVCNSLNSEAEDGSTPISRMLDKATAHVADQGEDGIDVEPTT